MAKGSGKGINRTQGVVGYLRVSTEEQAISGLGMAAQEAAIRTEAERRQLPVVALHRDPGVSAKGMKRPGLADALADLDVGKGSVLVVAKLDRLSRNVHDASGLLERSQRAGWDLVALDAPVDTTTPQGAAMAQVLAVFAELERKLIGERTKAALAVKRSQGVRLGRPSALPIEVVDRILDARESGRTWAAIAYELNDARVPTAQGGRQWHAATVRYVALSARAASDPRGQTQATAR